MAERFFYSAKPLKTIDGDTVDVLIDLGFDVFHKIRVRLYGINTPESRTSNKEEKVLGLRAKQFTNDWLSAYEYVYIKTIVDKNEKYGRTLAKIYSGEKIEEPFVTCLNNEIVKAGLAREYFGSGDKTWTEFKS